MILGNRIRKHERGLLFRRGDFARVLQPGKHRFISRLWARKRDRLDVVSTLSERFEHAELKLLAKEDSLREMIQFVELADNERAIVWRVHELIQVLGPGLHAFWKGQAIDVQVFTTLAPRLTHSKLEALVKEPSLAEQLDIIDLPDSERAIVWRAG